MGEGKNFSDMAPTGEVTDPISLRKYGSGEPGGPSRPTRFMPSLRGVVAPVVGTAGSGDVIEAMARSGGGWLHVDGAAVSMGSFHNAEPLLAFADAKALLDQVYANLAVMEHIRRQQFDEQLADHVASFGDDSGFEPEEISEQLEDCFPLPHIDDELAVIGWFKIDLYRDDGAKVVRCAIGNSIPPVIMQYVSDMAHRLGARLSIDHLGYRGGRPSCRRGDEVRAHPSDFDGLTSETFASLSGFKSYDPETRVVSFTDREVTVTLPGGLAPGAEPAGGGGPMSGR